MQAFEVWSLVIAAGALLISALSPIHSMRTSKRQSREEEKLRDLQERIAALHLEQLEEVTDLKSKPVIDVCYESWGQSNRIILRNSGGAAAHNVQLTLQTRENQRTPLVNGDADRKMPIEVFRPNEECPLLAAASKDSFPPYDITVSWEDDEGSAFEEKHTLYG